MITRNLEIRNPKQSRTSLSGRDAWFPYYAGFSTEFARSIIKSADLKEGATILDPWNGAGTTTTIAKEIGKRAIGIDINPAMIVASKARSLCVRQKSSLVPIAKDIIDKAHLIAPGIDNDDPLLIWFMPKSTCCLRRVEASIQKLLLGKETYGYLFDINEINDLSDIAAFYYTALFRLVRGFIKDFVPSNPTWTKRPDSPAKRVRPSPVIVYEGFLKQVMTMVDALESEQSDCIQSTELKIIMASSEKLPLFDDEIDFVLSSPPYCTRIDYAIATMPELAVLGFDHKVRLDRLRRSMIGTATVPKLSPQIQDDWGKECLSFLQKVYNHKSKASNTYYFKNHVQYFSSIFSSLSEIYRVLKKGGACSLVVQDSYYKDVHNDLPRIFAEMFNNIGMSLNEKIDFTTKTSMASRNSYIKAYRKSCTATESVICFTKLW